MVKEIKLGDTVIDKISGFKGTVIEKTEFLNGCIQFGILPRCGKDGKMPEAISIDIQCLELVKKEKKVTKKKPTGGANRPAKQMRGYLKKRKV